MNVIVSGAGIAGLTLAFSLERHGHSVLMIERAAHLRDDGYMIDSFGSGYDAMLIPDVVEQCEHSTSLYADNVEQVDLPRWSAGRVVLLGDACQCVSPLAGQGASMAVAGAYILTDLLSKGRDLTATLAVYERTLKPTIKRQQAAARRLAHWFVPTSESRLWIRNLVTRASVLPPVAAVLWRRMAAHSVFRH